MATEIDTMIEAFTIQVPQEDLDDLQNRLARTRYAQEIPDGGVKYGIQGSYVRDLIDTWTSTYDWRAWELRLNAFPQFMADIDGQPVHFLHIRSAAPDALPLVLLHGFPGSIVEFIGLIGPLTDPVAFGGESRDAFHVVIPSYPGFGFSGPTTTEGWDTRRIALAIAELMHRLGYDRYGTQGGDMGAFVGPELGRVDAEHVIGVHVNAATMGFIPWGERDDSDLATFSNRERASYDRLQWWLHEGNGYFQIQATRPQTVAYGLSDSPVGQLAWIADWFLDGLIDRHLMLTNVMLYWLNNTSASAARLYYENMHSGNWPTPTTVPTGVANFSEDIAIRRYAEQGNNIVHWTDLDRGGHFAAMEVPDLLVEDVRTFFASLR